MRVPDGIDEIYMTNPIFREYHEYILEAMEELNQRYLVVNWKHSDSAFLNFVLYLSSLKRNIRKLCAEYINKNNQHEEWAFKLYMFHLINRAEHVENMVNSRRRVHKQEMKNKKYLESICDHFESTNID